MSRAERDATLTRDDALARRLAQEVFDRPLVLEAGAGTGKTTTLVARVLAWCLGPGWERSAASLREEAGEPSPERVAARCLERTVAITFTEAAAAQLSEKTGEALRALESGTLPLGAEEACLPEPSLRAERARALRGALDHLVAQTIHAWCRRLLVLFPLEAGLHPQLEVDADGALRREIVREVLEERLRDAYTAAGDPAYLRLAARGLGPREIEVELLALLDEGVSARALDIDPFSRERVDALRARLTRALGDFTRADAGRLGGVSGATQTVAAAEGVARAASRVSDVPGAGREALAATLDALAASIDDKNLSKLNDWGRGKLGVKERQALGDETGPVSAAAAALGELLASLRRVDVALADDARRVLGELLAETVERMRRRGVASFSALLTETRELLVARPDVAARTRGRIDQLLVDEFQDTDQRQCDILRAVVLDGSERERPGLFLVGDPKQSIYGWRSADLAAYDAFLADVDRAGGERARLSVNHRSVPPILDEVERVVSPVMVEQPGLQPPFEPLVACEGRAGDDGFTDAGRRPAEYWVSSVWNAESRTAVTTRAVDATRLEATALARDLRSLHDEAGVPWASFGVLFRGRADWEIYLTALREHGVPFAVEGDRSYYQRREVIDAAALVRCVLDPNDHLALLTWLRSAAVGVPDAALIPLWTRDFPGRVSALHEPDAAAFAGIEAVLAEVVAALAPDVPGLERVAGWDESLRAAVQVLAALRLASARDPADDFVEALRTLSLFEASESARYLGAWRNANLERFFRELRAELVDGGGPHAVLRLLRGAVFEEREAEEGRPREIVDDAVSVMTIHGAKGLDFEHVYLMQLHKGSGRGPDGARARETAGGTELCLFGAPTLDWDLACGERRRVEEAERVRTLYVAMTRAKVRFVLAGLWPEHQRAGVTGQPMELLQQREPRPELDTWMAELDARGDDATTDATGTRWVFPTLAAPTEAEGAAREPVALPAAADVAAASLTLRAARAQASAEMQRRFGGRASEEAHHDRVERIAEQRFGEAPLRTSSASHRDASASGGERGGEISRAVGTAIHRALERFDLEAERLAELARRREELADTLAGLLPPELRQEAGERAEALLDRIAGGALLDRLRALAPHLVARELPVLLPPDAEGGAASYVAGALDLVYRDPETGELVVADYKTDAEERADYAPQGALYARALRDALQLEAEPRVEFWYLGLDRVVVH